MTAKEIDKEQRLIEIEEFVIIEASIECSSCHTMEFDMDQESLAETVFKLRWKVIKDEIYCNKCARKLLKK